MPRAIMWTVGPNAALGPLMAVTLVFHLGNAEEILNTPTGQPFMQVFLNGTGSLPSTNAMVTPGWNIQMRAVLTSLVITSLLACINLGSTTALNAINSLGGVSIISSYMVTLACLIWRRLYGEPLPQRKWSLGRWGVPVNIAALLFLSPLFLFYNWPLAQPVTASNHNWGSTMFAGILGVAAIYYRVHGRHVYSGPVVLINREA